MKQDAIKKMNQEAVDAANKKLQAANAPKSDDEVMGDIEAQEANLKKQLKDGTISQAQFDLKQADLMAKAQGLGLAGEREMASRGEDREVAGIASPDQEQKEIVDFTGMTEREKLEYLRDKAKAGDIETSFLDDIMKVGAIANQALASQGGYRVAQAKLPSMKTDMASRYDKLIKEYDALRKPSSKGKDIYKVGDELVQVKDGQVKKLYEGKGKKADWKEKEEFKVKAKEQVVQRKENRQKRKEVESDISTTEKLLKNLKDTKKLFEEYSKKTVAGTGWAATGLGAKKLFDKKLERLDAKFKENNVEKMASLFKGMSKAVDSDAERAAFEKAQPSITNDDDTNRKILEDRIKAAEDLLIKQKSTFNSIDKEGNIKEVKSAPKKITEDIIKSMMEKNPKASRERIIQGLKSKGYE